MDEGAKVPVNDAPLKPEDIIPAGEAKGCCCRPRRRKLIRLALALLVSAVGVTAWLMWDSTPAGPPQIVTLRGGVQIQFIGATYGTNHAIGSPAARWVNRLPSPEANFLRKHLGTRLGNLSTLSTGKPSLVAWFQVLGTNWPPLGASLSAAVLCTLVDDHDLDGEAHELRMMGGPGKPVAIFPVIPRRCPLLQLRLYQETTPVIKHRRSDEIWCAQFPNPLYGRYPQWKPEPVPAVKMAGDLEVRLVNFTTEILDPVGLVKLTNGQMGSNYQWDGSDVRTVFHFAYHSPRGTNERWEISDAELSDATGNVLRDSGWPGGKRVDFVGTLWPDEAAWRLKLELTPDFGYPPEKTRSVEFLVKPPKAE